MVSYAVTTNGAVQVNQDGTDVTKTNGVSYKSDAEALAHLRSMSGYEMYDHLGNVICEFHLVPTTEEQAVIDSQVIRYGDNRGMTKGQVAAGLAPEDVKLVLLGGEV